MKIDDQWVLNHICAKKNEGNNRGGGGRTTPVITACMSRSWKVEVCQKKKITTGRRDDQSAISSKEHVKYEATQTYSCQLRTNTTACTWPANDYSKGVRDHSNNKARHPPKSLLGEKNTKRVRCDTGRMHATHWFLPWILSTCTTTFTWRSLTTGGTIIFLLIFCVENVWYTPDPCHKICRRQKAYCVRSYSYVPTSKYIACTSTNHVDLSELV